VKHSEKQEQRLLLKAEYLQNRDKDVDKNHRDSIERSERLIEEDAARLVFNDYDTDAERVIERLRSLVEFLLCPAAELASIDVEFLEFRNGLMADYRLASLLRIYTSGIWYGQWCHELRQYVVSRWEDFKREDGSSIKKSWEQKRPKGAAEKNSKKDLKPKLNYDGKKDSDYRKQERDLEGKFKRLRKKNTDLG
jgi:hypothetical protein